MISPLDNHQRRYPALRDPDPETLDALIWLSMQPQAKPIIAWLLACSADKDDVLRKAEGTPLFRAQGANQVLLDLLEYIANPGEYKKRIESAIEQAGSRGSRFRPNPLNKRGTGW